MHPTVQQPDEVLWTTQFWILYELYPVYTFLEQKYFKIFFKKSKGNYGGSVCVYVLSVDIAFVLLEV